MCYSNGIDVHTFRPRTEAVCRIRAQYGLDNKYVILGVATGWSEEVGLSTFLDCVTSFLPILLLLWLDVRQT